MQKTLSVVTSVTCTGIPYEITTYTSELSGAGTSADVYIVLYGRNICTAQKSLCINKQDRKKAFEKGKCSKFIIEVIKSLRFIVFSFIFVLEFLESLNNRMV